MENLSDGQIESLEQAFQFYIFPDYWDVEVNTGRLILLLEQNKHLREVVEKEILNLLQAQQTILKAFKGTMENDDNWYGYTDKGKKDWKKLKKLRKSTMVFESINLIEQTLKDRKIFNIIP